MKTNNTMIKKYLTSLFAFFCFLQGNAQELKHKVEVEDLPIIFMGEDVNIHIIAPEPIQFVDLSTYHLVGDLPSENIARVKVQIDKETTDTPDATQKQPFFIGQDIGVITIVGQSFMAQYRAIWQDKKSTWINTNLHIEASQMQPLEYPKMKYSNYELKRFALQKEKKAY